MVVFTPDESKEEPFNTAIDDASDDPTIVMGKPVTTAFVSDDIRIPTEKVGCLQVTSQLQEFLNHFPPESIEKAFEQIYQILQVLDAYLIDNPQQHQYCMSPDSEYICRASATPPAFLSTTPHIPSSLEGMGSHTALNGYGSLNIANDLG